MPEGERGAMVGHKGIFGFSGFLALKTGEKGIIVDYR